MDEHTASRTDPKVVETHISTLFFTADRVYKLAKRVDLPFLQTTAAIDRVRLAAQELDLNSRFAPDVYLGFADVVERGELVDRMIVMRRLPEHRRLSLLLDTPEAPDLLRAVARQVAACHAAADPLTTSTVATAEAVGRNWADNFAAIEPHLDTVIDRTAFADVRRLAENYLRQHARLFERRIRDGFVRDGHGDLIADDIFCLDDGPRILDCLAFDDDLRIGDVVNDIAFLAMDVHRIAGPELAQTLLEEYQEFGYERHPASLAHFYIAYRSHVRAKVACVRVAQGDRTNIELARRHHDLALRYLERAQTRIVMVGGGPGVGKTLLSQRLADHHGYVHLATDEIRHDVARIPHGQHAFAEPDQGVYSPELVDATYTEMIREASTLLDEGHGVVLDASWTLDRHRAATRALAAELGVDLVEFECVLDDDLARERIARRLANPDDPSDATPDLVDRLQSRREPWSSAVRLSTAPPIDEVVATAVTAMQK